LSNIPATPVLCPHFGFVLLVRSEVFTVVSITGVNLLREKDAREFSQFVNEKDRNGWMTQRGKLKTS